MGGGTLEEQLFERGYCRMAWRDIALAAAQKGAPDD